MCGRWSETKAVTSDTPEIQKICDDVQSLVEIETKKKYAVFKAVKYRDCKVEKDTYYLFKVCVGKGERDYIHFKVYQPFKGGLEVPKVWEDKTKDDPL